MRCWIRIHRLRPGSRWSVLPFNLIIERGEPLSTPNREAMALSEETQERLGRAAWFERMYEEFTEFLAPDHRETTIEVGCGAGALTRKLAIHTRQVVGVDPSPGMIRRARLGAVTAGLRNVFLRESEPHEIPFADGTYRTVVSSLPFMVAKAERARIFAEMLRVCSVGGEVGVLVVALNTLEAAKLFQRFEFTEAERIDALEWVRGFKSRPGSQALADELTHLGLDGVTVETGFGGLVRMAKGTKAG